MDKPRIGAIRRFFNWSLPLDGSRSCFEKAPLPPGASPRTACPQVRFWRILR
jgi:hypothetical protein